MSSERDKVFQAIRAALAPLPERTPRPDWADDLIVSKAIDPGGDLVTQFVERLQLASGQCCDDPAALWAILKSNDCSFGYCDPWLSPLFENLPGVSFETEFDVAKIDDYTFGITKATLAVAESGTLMFRDSETSSRLGSLAPWVHIAVVDRKDIVATIGEAIARFGDDPSIIFATGPSKTADVEGILIEGVHGPGVQVAYLI